MKRLIVSLTALSLFIFAPAFAESEPSLLKVHLKMDKQKFLESEDVVLHIFVKNISHEINSFVTYDRDGSSAPSYTTFQPLVFDMQGREQENIVPYRMENKTLEQILPDLNERVIELAPGESMVHRVNLKDFFKLAPGMKYRVRSLFYPDIKEKIVIKGDNELSFRIERDRSYSTVRSGIQSQPEDRTYSREIAPSEVISLALAAERDNDWQRLRKYLYIEKFINSYAQYVRIYNQSDAAGKKEIEDDFVRYLSRDRHDYIVDFKISKEFKDEKGNIAFVEAIVNRFGVRRPDRYKYKYTLEKKELRDPLTNKKSYEENLWLITNVEAVVMKGAIK